MADRLVGEQGNFDLAVVGAGPGGCIAAIRAAQLGLRVADWLCQGVQSLLKKNRIELVRGRAQLSGATSLEVSGPDARSVEAHVIGVGATELVAELSLAMQLEATTAEVAHTVHAHPTLSETIWEAALSAEGRSLSC